MKSTRLAVRRVALLAYFAALLAMTTAATCRAQATAWVDFTSDMHNGAAGGPNGVADWIDELAKVTSGAGVDPFSALERAAIEADILSQLATIYADYDVSFTTTVPGIGPFDAIAYGMNSFGFGSFGEAPNDSANIASSQVAGVATGNFDSIIDEFDGLDFRATQMSQLATALAGTGAHELGHTFGLMHHHAYSDPSVTPATYLATGGVQNSYIMATGPTGLSETEREVLRSFSPWEKAMLDVAGGAAAGYPASDNQALVGSPILIDLSEEGPVDAGPTPLTAKPITFATGETSGMELALVGGDTDGAEGDMDMYKFFVPAPGVLTAEIFSTNRFGVPDNFDAMLVLIGPGGPIGSNDDVFFDGDAYGAVTFRENDPYLLNLPLAVPGEYFLMVHVSPTPMAPPPVLPDPATDYYWLMVGVQTIPEPGSLALLAVGAMAVILRKRR
jgi:hypothetical protein